MIMEMVEGRTFNSALYARLSPNLKALQILCIKMNIFLLEKLDMYGIKLSGRRSLSMSLTR